MPTRQPVLEIDAAHRGDAYVVRVKGELDLAGAPALELALGDAERSPADQVVLDLEELTFIDARGLHVLIQAGLRSASNGSRLQVTGARGRVADMFRLTGLDKWLPLADARPAPQSAALVSATAVSGMSTR